MQRLMLTRPAHSLILSMLIAICLSGCGPKPPAKTRSPAPQANAYLALGDSYTYGESVEYEDCWPVLLAQALRKNNIDISEPIFCARTGWATDDLQKALDKEHYSGPFRLVTLQIGVMDYSRRSTPEEFRPKFARLLSQAVELSGGNPRHVLVISIPDYDYLPYRKFGRRNISKTLVPMNAVCREEAKKQGVVFIDVTEICKLAQSKTELQSSDEFHFTGEMYRLWVEAMLPDALKVIK